MNETFFRQGLLSVGLWTAEATVILFCAWLVTLRLRRNAALRHLTWLSAFCALLVLPLLSAVVPTLLVVRTSAPAKVGELLRSAPWENGKNTVFSRVTHRTDREHPHSPAASRTEQSRTVSASLRRYGTPVGKFCFCLWTLGFVTVLTRLLSAFLGIHRLMARSVKQPLDALTREQLAARVGLRRTWDLRICLTAFPPVAMTWGFFRPVVLLPKDASNWSSDQWEAAMLHELAHVKRGDSASQLFALCVCAVFWFHPAVWLAAAAMRADAELAADDAVVLSGMKPSTYAAQLLGFAAQLAQKRPHPLNMGVSLMNFFQIETRIQSIVSASSCRRTVTASDALQTGSLAFLLVLIFAAIRPAASAADQRQAPLASLKPTALLSRLHQAVPGMKSIAFIGQSLSPASARRKRNTRSLSPNVLSNSDLRRRRPVIQSSDVRPRVRDENIRHGGSADVLARSSDSPPDAPFGKPNSVQSSADRDPGLR